jgi:hypothetical protein
MWGGWWFVSKAEKVKRQRRQQRTTALLHATELEAQELERALARLKLERQLATFKARTDAHKPDLT